ncbi:BON domain-containing protein [Ramlibacter sp. AW1]|uniref:BON domain-containing protein n=1 Tax=Ramlibacter aurantiacus TaxID=2801330 RepID=A0A936ZGP5_9BURK|nr:BON domain-containing protein [Ramlibacter aurantiacus]MBL0420597.1 BON domain-containing protein [Ramlibacter aurantiacus]
MRLISFLAGVGAGLLMAPYVSRASGTDRAQGLRRVANTGRSSASAGTSSSLDGRATERDYPTHSPPRSDDELRERICSRLGRTIHDPEAIEVDVRDGSVTLRGRVQARDTILLMAEIENTAGVKSVRNEMEILGSLEDVAPSMTRHRPAARAGEPATPRLSRRGAS